MNKQHISRIVTVLTFASVAALPCSQIAYAAIKDTTNTDSQRLATVKARGDAEISRRLTTLNALSTKISDTAKLTTADKTALENEVAKEISSLTALRTKLDAETVLADAFTDAKSIVIDYRVYALIVPKINLVRTADDQQVVESKLTDLATKLQARIQSAQTAGKNIASLQAQLDDLQAKVHAAQSISMNVEASVVVLQPTDYDNDHTILSGYRDQLKTAHSDNQAAVTDAKAIVSALKNL